MRNWPHHAALAHWHMSFMTHWREEGHTLLSSLIDAITDAAQDGCYPPWDLITPPTGLNQPDFHIDTYLVVCGFGEMHFNEYNHSGDWPSSR
jgi:hypothetical protein